MALMEFRTLFNSKASMGHKEHDGPLSAQSFLKEKKVYY